MMSIPNNIVIDWNAYGYRRAFANWFLADESPEVSARSLACWDAEALVHRLLAAGVETFTIDARSQWSAHYPSEFFRQAPLLEGRDLFGELLRIATAHGLNIVAYIPTECAGRATVEHPDWAVQDQHGQPLRFGKTDFYRACPNSGYRRFEMDCQRELVTKYPDIAGLYYDGPGYIQDCYDGFYCFCPGCRASFRKFAGRALPTEPAWGTPQWAEYLEWRSRCSVEVVRDYVRAVKEIRPHLPITANMGYSGWAGTGEEICSEIDQASVELGFGDSAFVLTLAKAAMQDGPVDAYTHATPRTMAGALPKAELRYRTYFILARGATPDLTWGNDEAIKRMFDELSTRIDACKDTRHLPWCGLVHSRKTRHFHNRGWWGATAYKYESYGHLAMLEDEHLPMSIVLDDVLADGRLEDYAVLVLPDVAVIDEPTADRLRKYVHNGGGLVATEHTSLRDTLGNQRDSFLLEDLLGVRYTGGAIRSITDSPDGRELPLAEDEPVGIGWEITDHDVFDSPEIRATLASDITDNPRPQGGMSQNGKQTLIEALSGTEVIATAGGSPLITLRSFGRGLVAYVASDIGTSYRNLNRAWMHHVWGRLVRHVAATPPPVEVQAPTYCKATFWTRANETIVHLLADPHPFGRWPNAFGGGRIHREDAYPVLGVRLTMHADVSAAHCVPTGETLDIHKKGNTTVIDVPAFHEHVIVVLRT